MQASPHHLTKADLVRRILAREQARFLCLVHDLIPIEYPEYARPNGAALHRKRAELFHSCNLAEVATAEAKASAG